MVEASGSGGRIGYTRYEFNRIFCVYSRNVYNGLFRDFSFADVDGKYYISFREDAAKVPLVTVEKRRLGPDRSLFIATTPAPHGKLATIARSEKIESFVEQLDAAVRVMRTERASVKISG